MNTVPWRAMTAADLPAVTAIADIVHGHYTEPVEVYAERLALCPQGCFVAEADGAIAGLLVTHPWHRNAPPRLRAMLGAIPPDPDGWYLHDIALLPAMRGSGAGRVATELTIDLARRAGIGTVTLVAVSGADSYWATQGFVEVPGYDVVAAGYGDEARLMQRPV